MNLCNAAIFCSADTASAEDEDEMINPYCETVFHSRRQYQHSEVRYLSKNSLLNHFFLTLCTPMGAIYLCLNAFRLRGPKVRKRLQIKKINKENMGKSKYFHESSNCRMFGLPTAFYPAANHIVTPKTIG